MLIVRPGASRALELDFAICAPYLKPILSVSILFTKVLISSLGASRALELDLPIWNPCQKPVFSLSVLFVKVFIPRPGASRALELDFAVWAPYLKLICPLWILEEMSISSLVAAFSLKMLISRLGASSWKTCTRSWNQHSLKKFDKEKVCFGAEAQIGRSSSWALEAHGLENQ